jgi:glycosyltransferase involved in cell wall biosynthesis
MLGRIAMKSVGGASASVLRPKLLHVLEATYGGTASYISDLLLNIDTKAFDVSFAYSPIRCRERLKNAVGPMAARGVRIYEIPMQRNISPVEDWRALRELCSLIKRQKFDIVHGHSSKAGFLARVAAKLASPRTVTIYSPHAICLSGNTRYWYLERFASFFTNMVLGVSRTEIDELKTYRFISDAKLRYVTAGIDSAVFVGSFGGTDFRKQLGVADDVALIGSAGRITAQKDPLTFVKSAAELIRRGTKAHFAWAGDGELKSASEKLAKDLGIDRHVTFLGYCPDIKPFLDALDIFALTSRYESFGYVTCEAMAMGKPIVATNVSGSKELVVHSVTGYVAEVADISGLATALQELARDKELRRSMGAAGKARVTELYDLRRMIRDVEQIYRELLSAANQVHRERPVPAVASLEVKRS